MSKFKIGDHVVVVSDEQHPRLIGATGTVIEDNKVPYVRLDDKSLYRNGELDRMCFYEKDLELSHIANSPLWKALS